MLDQCIAADTAMHDKERRAQYLDQASKLIDERDEPGAVQEALPDLVRLDRYARRAWSRQKRAIRNYMKIRQVHQVEKPDRASASQKRDAG